MEIGKRKAIKMRTFRKFEITSDRAIEFLLEDPQNYGYFSQLRIEYYFENKKIKLFDDFVIEGIRTFKNVLQKCLNGEKNLPSNYFEKGIGYRWNKTAYQIAEGDFSDDDATSSFLMWETVSGMATWIYTYKGKTYLEISPQYQYNYSEPDKDFVPFETYMANYEMVDRIELAIETIDAWYNDVSAILKKLDY
ncbi:hypothetical protein [Enterococcus pallens]|nr:hypothetical protein [Enterococcus pallens]